ncbi:hypothetical protein MH117_18250 [Paenibacillus sp. ACRRX]|uniref:hypothetical protein n=1 Tax=Paenibacillus sp. ACRRX TaxID=2918206 RepID=UPI001EF4B6D9|nr:hypothetical protein [Paenibacillus sp. ACRRX]MCG7409363.1 hypothetical protein [Paenibacillus sp. ACRRX]
MNKEKTSRDEGFTHGEMVRCLFHTRCQTYKRIYKSKGRIYVDFDVEVKRFARRIRLFWLQHYLMLLWGTPKPQNYYQVLPQSA